MPSRQNLTENGERTQKTSPSQGQPGSTGKMASESSLATREPAMRVLGVAGEVCSKQRKQPSAKRKKNCE